MINTLTRNWWLLALCGFLHAVIAGVYLTHYIEDTGFHVLSTVALMGKLALAAGACAIAAGIWRSAEGKCWPLVLTGLGLAALGLILTGIFGSDISFGTVSLLIILMATGIGILEFVTARTLRRQRHVADGWLLGAAGAVSVGLALVFLALGIRWIEVEPGSLSDLLWLGSYFGFTAICMLGLAMRLNSPALARSD